MFKKLITKGVRLISYKIVGRQATRKALIRFSHLVDMDLLEVGHYERGICKYFEVSGKGEHFFLNKLLRGILDSITKEPVVFDVGANIGEYSLDVSSLYPSATIYAFEPNPATFKVMQERTAGKRITPINVGVGEKKSVLKIQTYKDNPESQLASFVPGVMSDLHHADSIIAFEVDVIDLDAFCMDNKVNKINFLKIDTEGYELEVIKGAKSLIKNAAIDVVQFEFNQMNLYSRVFLKDFYDHLTGFEFFRMDTDKLIYLGKYDTVNEVFRFQNYVAIRKDLVPQHFYSTLKQ